VSSSSTAFTFDDAIKVGEVFDTAGITLPQGLEDKVDPTIRRSCLGSHTGFFMFYEGYPS
jgi:hypothetical protein